LGKLRVEDYSTPVFDYEDEEEDEDD